MKKRVKKVCIDYNIILGQYIVTIHFVFTCYVSMITFDFANAFLYARDVALKNACLLYNRGILLSDYTKKNSLISGFLDEN